MYFQKFPRLFYDFKTPNSNDTKLYTLTDITTNVRVRKNILENITLYDEYDVMEGETPEIIAEKFYGNPELHWIIMIANQRYDYLNDFPMNSLELDQHVESIYGVENKFKIHHYEKNSLIANAKAYLKIPFSMVNLLKSHDILYTPTATCKLEPIVQSYVTNRQFLVSLSKGKFEYGDTVVVRGFREDDEGVVGLVNDLYTFTLEANPLELFPEYKSVTNYDHEFTENEKKRRIKLISPRLVEQVIRELEDLLK